MNCPTRKTTASSLSGSLIDYVPLVPFGWESFRKRRRGNDLPTARACVRSCAAPQRASRPCQPCSVLFSSFFKRVLVTPPVPDILVSTKALCARCQSSLCAVQLLPGLRCRAVDCFDGRTIDLPKLLRFNVGWSGLAEIAAVWLVSAEDKMDEYQHFDDGPKPPPPAPLHGNPHATETP